VTSVVYSSSLVQDIRELAIMLSPPLPSFRLDGKKALITGAGRGIGAAGAAVFAQAGAAVMLYIFIFDM
jgi:hypothetical protein